MTRNLKAIVLAVGAVLSMSAVLASAAQAETGVLTAQQYPATITGEQQAGTVTFDIGAPPVQTVSCATSDLDATIFGPTDPVTFKPTYTGCTALPGFTPVTVTTNGCDYTFGFTRPGTTGDPFTTGKMEAAIDCPEGQQLEIHVYQNAAQHAGNVSTCTYDIMPQPAVAAGVYHNTMVVPNDITATVNARFTARSTVGPAFICGVNPNEHLPITLTSDYTLRAFEDLGEVEGAQIGLDVG